MASASKVYIAGVGSSPLPSKNASTRASIASSISAATKALLDAGVTYDDITHGVVSKSFEHGTGTFASFEEGGVTLKNVEKDSELESAFALVTGQDAQSVLMLAKEESSVIAFVLVSDRFLWSRSYLKDSSALLSEQSSSKGQASKKLHDICQMVWALRGWTDGIAGQLVYQSSSGKSFELSRADEKKTPKWKDVEHKQDGKHRLGYNPAKQTEDIRTEDFEAVISSSAKTSKKTDEQRFKRRGGDRATLARL